MVATPLDLQESRCETVAASKIIITQNRYNLNLTKAQEKKHKDTTREPMEITYGNIIITFGTASIALPQLRLLELLYTAIIV